MECTLCNKQYVGNAETAFNIRLNNHRKDTKDSNAIVIVKATIVTAILNL